MKATVLYPICNTSLVLLLLLFNLPPAFNQEVLVSGEASALMNNTLISKKQYEEEAYQMAVNNAIDKYFGSSVMSNYEHLSSTEMQGRSVSSQTDFRNNYLSSYPNGIWVMDKSRKCYEEQDARKNWWMTCKVTGIAREIESAKVQFLAETLYGTDPKINKSESFNAGESGYVFFKSAEPGYLIIFYDDMKTVQRCLPYNAMNETALKIEANKEYIFFSQQHADYMADKTQVDEIEYFTDVPIDYNQYYLVFSPEPFKGYLLNSPENMENGYSTFRSMEREKFHKWLQENRIRNKDLQVKIIGVSIKKTEFY
ncbi:MAG: hypothetical protein HC906_12065 [Bacteroidales bacterium]|nr:hypothetical protein [Bacteroidales bacterium]